MHIPEKAVSGALRALPLNRMFESGDAARQHVERRALRPRPYAPPRRLGADVQLSAARRRGWPVYRVSPAAGPSTGSVVYAHGGAWVEEMFRLHWQLIAQIAVESRTTVVVPIYPLVPFGTAADVTAEMVEIVRECREAYGSVGLAGDSAGGQIALSTALAARDEHDVPIQQTVLISPALDASFSNPEIPAVQPHDPLLAVPGGRVFADYWRGDLSPSDPRASPVAGDLRGLGPVTVFSGTHDILNPDARLLAQRATDADVELEFHERPELIHVYPLLPTRSGRDARRVITDRLAR